MLWCSFLFDVFDVKRFFSDINVLVISERSLTRSPTLLLFWLMWVPFTDCPFAKLIEPCIKLQSITKTINEIDFAPSSFLFKQMNFLFANLIFNALLFAFQVNFYTFIVISDTLLIFAIVFVTIIYYSFTRNKFFHYSWVIFMVIKSYYVLDMTILTIYLIALILEILFYNFQTFFKTDNLFPKFLPWQNILQAYFQSPKFWDT